MNINYVQDVIRNIGEIKGRRVNLNELYAHR